jgi:hypothetical protein
MNNGQITHIGFSDESNWSKGRFRSIGIVTCRSSDLPDFDKELGLLLQDASISELQWKKLNGADKREAAKKACKFVLEKAHTGFMRVDVLIWDIQDSRHNVWGRDDIANLQRMYYHLFRNVMRARWPKEGVWCLRPDKHTAIDWMKTQACLENVAVSVDGSLCGSGGFRLQLSQEFSIEEIHPTTSAEHPPMLQIADLFAGLAVFSRENFKKYEEWKLTSKGQSRLFQFSPTEDIVSNQCTASLSNKDRERFQVLQHFDELCKRHKIGVSLKTKKGLYTPNPMMPINFWLYEPQDPKDKAPLRT